MMEVVIFIAGICLGFNLGMIFIVHMGTTND